jgi:hypothetical protein
MKEELITFETAKLAKERGFDLETSRIPFYYDVKGNEVYYTQKTHTCIIAPTQSLLQKWLREKHKLFLTIDLANWNENYFLFNIKYKNDKMTSTAFDSYEEALEGGLYGSLTKVK